MTCSIHEFRIFIIRFLETGKNLQELWNILGGATCSIHDLVSFLAAMSSTRCDVFTLSVLLSVRFSVPRTNRVNKSEYFSVQFENVLLKFPPKD